MLLSEIEKNAYSLLPTIPFLVICPRETLTQVEKGSHKIIFFFNIICDGRKLEGTCPSQCKWISKLRQISSIAYYTALTI